MKLLASSIKWIMIVSGILTFTMVYAAIAPEAALKSTFGESLSGPLAEVIVRNWGALIAMVGVMLVYGAFKPSVRPIVLPVAAASKIVFITLLLTVGQAYASKAMAPLVIDSIMVIIFTAYLISARAAKPAA